MMDVAALAAKKELYRRASTSSAYISYAQRHRIDPWQVKPYAGATAIVQICEVGGGRFDFEPHLHAPDDPVEAFVCEAIEEDGETTYDLVAWPLDRPSSPLSMLGRVGLLNLWAAFNPASYYMGKALPVHRTALEWLGSGCTGTAIVSPAIAAREMLDLPGPLEARDMQHQRDLRAIAASIAREVRVVTAVQKQRMA